MRYKGNKKTSYPWSSNVWLRQSDVTLQWDIKGVTAKMWLSLSISGHTWVMESLEPRVKLFESFSSFNALTLGPSLRDSITKVWPEYERLSDIFAVTPFISSPTHTVRCDSTVQCALPWGDSIFHRYEHDFKCQLKPRTITVCYLWRL